MGVSLPRGAIAEVQVLSRLLAFGHGQAINRISVDTNGEQREHNRNCLLMPYTKSLASSVLTALELVGAPVCQSQTGGSLRILCIGFGGGSVPAFLVEIIPHCWVDVVELEPTVLDAADAMGFQSHPRITLHLQDGASFASEAVKNMEGFLSRLRKAHGTMNSGSLIA